MTLRDIFRTHAQFVGRSLRALGVRDEDLDDALQEVFIVAGKRIGEYEERGALKSWLYAICLFVARQGRRSAAKARLQESLDDEPAADGPDPEQAIESRLAFDRAFRMLDVLSPEQREAFLLHEIEELTLREVADAVGCPLQTVYSRVNVARQRLRLALEAHHEKAASP